MDVDGSGVGPDLDNNKGGAAVVSALKIDGGLVVRNVEALNAGLSLFKHGGGSGAGNAEGDGNGDCGKLHYAY